MLPSILLATIMAAGPALSQVLYVAVGDGNLTTLSIEGASLAMTSNIPACGANPSWLTYSEDLLYCSNEGSPGSLTSFAQTSTAILTPEANIITNGGDVSSTLYGDGQYIALAHYGQNSISTYKVPITNSSQPIQNITLPFPGKGPKPQQITGYPHQVIVDPTGSVIASPDLGADIVRFFAISSSTGHLNLLRTNITMDPGSGPRHVAFYQCNTTNTTYLYVVAELSNQLSGYRMDIVDDRPAFTRVVDPMYTVTNGTNTTTSFLSEVRVFGNTLTVSNRGDGAFGPGEDSLVVYQINLDGTLTNQRFFPAGGNFPRSFEISKDGTMIAVGNQKSNSVVVMQRDAVTGAIGPSIGNITLSGPPISVIFAE